MKLTCLTVGSGYHFPACHILDLCGFRILLDCPLDLSALSAFAPITVHFGKREAEASDLSPFINAVPWYKTVDSLHLFDPAFINVVLISSAMGMLGLPFLTRNKSFSGKIYATDVTMRLGQLMMDDLISMHREFIQLYGPEDCDWMKWEELEKTSHVSKVGTGLGGWLPLYSKTEVKDCIGRVHPLRYGEEACYNGTLVIKAVSSGLEIGASNWAIKTPKLDMAYITSSVIDSPQAMDFDYCSLQAHDVIIYSDISSLQNIEEDTTDEEIEKLEFICSCAFDSLIANGSVLVPIGRLGVILNLLEQISSHEKLSTLKIPVFVISSVSSELFSLLNIMPEWLSKKKQEKLFSGEPLFSHVDLLKEKRLHLIPDIYSAEVLKLWQEPCIVICPHWSLRIGPAVHLLQRWRNDENSLLVLENNVDPDLTLRPFKPMKMKVLQCSFVSGIRSDQIIPMMEKLKPKLGIFPESYTKVVHTIDSFPLLHYSENDTLRVPKLKMGSELEISNELGSELNGKTFEGYDADISRLRGELSMYHGKQRLVIGKGSPCCGSLLYWGTLDVERLLGKLEEMGINGVLGQGREDESVVVQLVEPCKGFIEVKSRSVVISTGDEKLAPKLFEAIESILDNI